MRQDPNAMNTKKHPLGLMPIETHRALRFTEVCGAISRYYNAGMEIPIKWVEEYNELIRSGVTEGLEQC